MAVEAEAANHENISQHLQDLISKNSELGSRLLSLLLVSSGNSKEIINAINNGDLQSVQNLNLEKLSSTVKNAKENTEVKVEATSDELKLRQLEKKKKNTEASFSKI